MILFYNTDSQHIAELNFLTSLVESLETLDKVI